MRRTPGPRRALGCGSVAAPQRTARSRDTPVGRRADLGFDRPPRSIVLKAKPQRIHPHVIGSALDATLAKMDEPWADTQSRGRFIDEPPLHGVERRQHSIDDRLDEFRGRAALGSRRMEDCRRRAAGSARCSRPRSWVARTAAQTSHHACGRPPSSALAMERYMTPSPGSEAGLRSGNTPHRVAVASGRPRLSRKALSRSVRVVPCPEMMPWRSCPAAAESSPRAARIWRRVSTTPGMDGSNGTIRSARMTMKGASPVTCLYRAPRRLRFGSSRAKRPSVATFRSDWPAGPRAR